MSEFNQSRREGQVKFGHDFSSVAEVTHLWGLSATKLPYQISFKIPNCDDAICLLLSENGGAGWRNVPCFGTAIDGRGWREIVRIEESNADREKANLHLEEELSNPRKRYVFWRMEREGAIWYKFFGVFMIDAAETNARKADGLGTCIYRKISDVAECPQFKMTTMLLTADSFCGMVGRTLETRFLTEVESETENEDWNAKSVKVWPGEKFVIDRVSSSAQLAYCVSTDGAARIIVPKRDIELGYFACLKGAS